ncbi:MAG: hypothetical protein MMC33_008321 [Icmadophila ericetorum]|nr:hypothetical protein [Icmadophila ericetorum]
MALFGRDASSLRAGRAPEVRNPFLDTDSTIDDTEQYDAASIDIGTKTNPPRNRNAGLPGPNGSLVARGGFEIRAQLWQDLSNKLLPPEESEMMIKSLEIGADVRLQRTYVEGVYREDVDEAGVVLKVGLTYLPGANKPEVTRLEEISMAGKRPDQRDAIWRVNTAATLLWNFDVSSDLAIIQSDRTGEIAREAKMRLNSRAASYTDSKFSWKDSKKPSKSLIIRGKQYDPVTIDSDAVAIVNDLRVEGVWDIQATLIEVDMPSLLGLITNYKYLISTIGPGMSSTNASQVLETMIEDARRLCIRSPVLFRMSTRVHIIRSHDTRYGINHTSMFRTLTTSKGIREMISLSASYFTSLDPASTGDYRSQSQIKSQFLQMLILLLSLLNNKDLDEIKDFLESTFEIRADRQHLEIVFLKLIPLVSINQKVFLKAMIPTCAGYPLQDDDTANYGEHWDTFIQTLLLQGFVLPGTVLGLGRDEFSWIVRWPEKKGFHSTEVFNNLQYHGCHLRAINDIPPIEVHREGGPKEITVLLSNGNTVVIGSADVDGITAFSPGRYTVQESGSGSRLFDLEIQEIWVNRHIAQATRVINQVIDEYNKWQGQASKRKVLKMPGSKGTGHGFLKGFKGEGRITRHMALLNQDTLAIAYKIDGSKVTGLDAAGNIGSEIRHLNELLSYIERSMNDVDLRSFNVDKRELKVTLGSIRQNIDLAIREKDRIYNIPQISDEPIEKILHPDSSHEAGPEIWNDYHAVFTGPPDNLLVIDAKRAIVKSFKWLSAEIVEVCLDRHSIKYFATPLRRNEPIIQSDEIEERDIVILAGQYMILAVESEDNQDDHIDLSMTNWLRIKGTEEESKSNRGANRNRNKVGRGDIPQVRSCFC